MKKRIFAFLSIVLLSTFFFVGCQNDDNQSQTPTNPVATEKQFKDIEAVNEEIKSFTENTFAAESGFIPAPKRLNKMNDCVTISSEVTDQVRTVIIDFGNGCEINGANISGTIQMSFAIELDIENRVQITYTLENFVYKDITVTGTATSTFVFNRNEENSSFSSGSETITDFSFTWTDGLNATNKSNLTNETLFTINPDTSTFEFYTLNDGNSSTEFSNGDRYTVEITTPLRNEGGCDYTVSGVIVTSQNSDMITLDFGDGQCDNMATQTDADGNQTTIEL